MPRLPVDGSKVIEHRVTLGGKEREILESAMTAYSFRNVATPIVNTISDKDALVFLGLVIAFFVPSWIPDDWQEVTEDMSPQQVKDWLEVQNLVGAGAGAAIFGPYGWVAAIIGALIGTSVVEVGEEVAADLASEAPIGVAAAMMVISNQLRKLGLNV